MDENKPLKRPRIKSPQLKFDKKMKIEACHHIYCMSDGAKYAYKRLKNESKLDDGQATPDEIISIDKCMCLGHCKKGPNFKVTYLDENKEEVLEGMNAFKAGELIQPYRKHKK